MATKLEPGYWRLGKESSGILLVEGNKLTFKNLVSFDYPDIAGKFEFEAEFGDFGEARKELADATGKDKMNVFIKSSMFSFKGIANDDGTSVTSWEAEIVVWSKMSEEEAEKLKSDRESFTAPSCPGVSACPEKKGKIYWLSGPPGAGKSTTCQLMARNKGFIYYEGDSIMQLLNPFVDVNAADPTKAAFRTKPLKDVPREDAEIILSMEDKIGEVFGAENFEGFDEAMRPLYTVMTKHVSLMKKKLGGDFAVAHAVATRTSRDFIRSLLGNDVVFIVLGMTLECSQKRVEKRHGDIDGVGDFASKLHKFYAPAGEDEPNSYNVSIEQGMSRDDVLAKVIDVVNKSQS